MCVKDGLEAFWQWATKAPSPGPSGFGVQSLEMQGIFPSQHLMEKEVGKVVRDAGCFPLIVMGTARHLR